MADYFQGPWQHHEKNTRNLARFSSLGGKLSVYDLGSAGGTPPPLCYILENIRLVNFEPDQRPGSQTDSPGLDIAIGPRQYRTLYLNARPTTSSLLKPNHRIVDRYDFQRLFGDVSDIFRTVSTRVVDTYGLDELIVARQLPDPDFIKIDVQGLTQEVLESAANTLSRSVIGLQAEVEFLETYAGQKTFGASHEYLYSMGFEIFTVSNLNRWPWRTKLALKKYPGQHAFCDLLYLRSIDSISRNSEFWNPEKAVKFIQIALLYDLTDTAAAYLDRFAGTGLISPQQQATLITLIENWDTALDFFYLTNKRPYMRFLDKLLDVSLRRIYWSLRSLLNRRHQD